MEGEKEKEGGGGGEIRQNKNIESKEPFCCCVDQRADLLLEIICRHETCEERGKRA